MRGANVAALALTTVCGVATAYVTLQPALEQQKEERDGTFNEHHHTTPQDQERIISREISKDFAEAKKELAKLDNGGFAWGIRKWFSGRDPRQAQSDVDGPGKNENGR